MGDERHSGLQREIGLLDATMIVISGIIGGGIFFTPAVVAQNLPNAGWIIAAWSAGAIIAFAGALTFAELGSRFPRPGLRELRVCVRADDGFDGEGLRCGNDRRAFDHQHSGC